MNNNIISRTVTNILGSYFIIGTIISIYFLINSWPVLYTIDNSEIWKSSLTIFKFTYGFQGEICLMIVVLFSSAIGSFVHSITSFASYVGNRKLVKSWIWWYLLRTFIGIGLAFIFYFTARAGLLTSDSINNLNPYGVAAISSLVGLFSKQATDKLRELFDVLFATSNGDSLRKDKLNESND